MFCVFDGFPSEIQKKSRHSVSCAGLLHLSIDLLGTAHLSVNTDHLHPFFRCHMLKVAVYRLIGQACALRNIIGVFLMCMGHF